MALRYGHVGRLRAPPLNYSQTSEWFQCRIIPALVGLRGGKKLGQLFVGWGRTCPDGRFRHSAPKPLSPSFISFFHLFAFSSLR